MLHLIQSTPVPPTSSPPAAPGFPTDLTTGGLLLLLGWVILNQLPGILKSFGAFINTLVVSRSARGDSYTQLMEQMAKDREYYDQERNRLESKVTQLEQKSDALEKRVDELDGGIRQRDETIAKLKRILTEHGIAFDT